jgi:hypothetical protein
MLFLYGSNLRLVIVYTVLRPNSNIKISKCKKKMFMEVLGTIQIIVFYIKTDFPISKYVKN